MKYSIIFEKNADKQLQKIDITQQRIIINWITNNLENTDNPRLYGKPLKGRLGDYWRYKVGNYRIVAEIKDKEIRVIIVRSDVCLHRYTHLRFGPA